MTDVISIDRGVPIPRRGGKYPYEELGVGDSFFVPNGESQLVSNNNWRMSKKLDRKFVCKKIDGGIRVWRTA
jgi:hypothetical protein